MNYRHAFHAGNFADLMKHGLLTHILASLTAEAAPLTVIDTHAGAGKYDLDGPDATRTGEGRAGVGVLMAAVGAPAAFDALKTAVGHANPAGRIRYYPGSPLLIAAALRSRDHYIACELRADDYAALKQALSRQPGAALFNEDGWRIAALRAPRAPAALLALVDPPFERADDYQQLIRLAGRIVGVNERATIATWLPIKDLARFDAFLTELEDAARGRPILLAEVRLRPLTDPMSMNGCALAVINPTPRLDQAGKDIVDWLAATLGATGGEGRVTALNGEK